jgi:hypothetical protein
MWKVIARFPVTLISTGILAVVALILWMSGLKSWIYIEMGLSFFVFMAVEAVVRRKERWNAESTNPSAPDDDKSPRRA